MRSWDILKVLLHVVICDQPSEANRRLAMLILGEWLGASGAEKLDGVAFALGFEYRCG